jgi:hypothetical protein
MNSLNEQVLRFALKSLISQEVARLSREQCGQRLRAVVLTGSLARDEATFVQEGEGWRALGDAEFILVFDPHLLLLAHDLELLRSRIEDSLLRQGVRVAIGLRATGTTDLRKMRPCIFTYELRVCGQVIWGDQQILSCIPAFTASDIPLEDAWQLLCNRIVEHLEVADELADGSKPLSSAAHYRTVKLFLDMATSLLVFAGRYEPTYRGREQQLTLLAERGSADDGWPFSLGPFAKLVTACTEWKLLTKTVDGITGRELWKAAVEYARLLWRWQLFKLTGASVETSDRKLMRKWMQLQPSRLRFREWARVLRRCGRVRSWREWPHWVLRGWQASPRYSLYAAACELFFQLPSLSTPSGQDAEKGANWEEMRHWLPLVNESQQEKSLPPWRRLAANVVRNYHEIRY